MPMRSNDSVIFQEFRDALGTRDPKTVAAYLTTMRDFVAWLATQPGSVPFRVELVTETAVRGYMDSLQRAGRAPRTRSKVLSGLRRFCQWAMDEGYLRRNPARAMERPTVVAVAPTELVSEATVCAQATGRTARHLPFCRHLRARLLGGTAHQRNCQLADRPVPHQSASWQYHADRCERRQNQNVGFAQYGSSSIV